MPRPVPVLLLALLQLLLWTVCRGQTCKPQGALVLDQPYPALQKPNPPLPNCKQFECSCCNASHVGTLQRGLATAAEDETFSRRCLQMLSMINCYVCDPEVGVGAKAAMCPGTCSEWYAACSEDFFGFQGQRQGLQPCTEADTDRFAVCAKLRELAGDGAGLCEAAGFKVAAADGSEPCFDGRPSAAAAELCAGAPLAQPQRAASSDHSDGGGASGGRAMMLDVVQTLRNATLTAAIAMLLARLFRAFQRQRDMQVALRRADPTVLADAAVRRVSAH